MTKRRAALTMSILTALGLAMDRDLRRRGAHDVNALTASAATEDGSQVAAVICRASGRSAVTNAPAAHPASQPANGCAQTRVSAP